MIYLLIFVLIVTAKSEGTYPPIYYYEVMGVGGDPLEITTDNYGNIFIKELIDESNEEYVTFDKEKFLDFIDTDMSGYSPQTKARIKERIAMEKRLQPKVQQIHLPTKYKENKQEETEEQESSKDQGSSEDQGSSKDQGSSEDQGYSKDKGSSEDQESSKDSTEEEESTSLVEMGAEEDERILYPREGTISVSAKKEDSSILIPTDIEDYGTNEKQLLDDGKSVKGGEYPYHALIYSQDKDNHICSGAAINNRFVITAATCVYLEKKENLRMTLGRGQSLKNYDISKIIFCDKFQILKNNIALLKTKQQMEEIDHPDFRTIDIPIGTEVTIIGSKCSNLRYGITKIVSNEKCRNTFKYAKEESICGEVSNNDVGKKCFEELGSPVIWNDLIIGVVSHSKTGQPSRYMSIDYYFDWIFREIVRNSVAYIG